MTLDTVKCNSTVVEENGDFATEQRNDEELSAIMDELEKNIED